MFRSRKTHFGSVGKLHKTCVVSLDLIVLFQDEEGRCFSDSFLELPTMLQSDDPDSGNNGSLRYSGNCLLFSHTATYSSYTASFTMSEMWSNSQNLYFKLASFQ